MVTNMYINGVDQGPGKCLRIPPNTDPVTDITSTDMACNVGGTKPVARVCPVHAGDSITFLWRAWPDGSQPGSIDQSHQGPCAVYMKAVNDATTAPGPGSGWFKIFDDGYRDGKFCSQRIIDNGGKLTIKLPRDLKGGDYLIRAEQLALHEAKIKGGAQWYIGCGQLVVSSIGGQAKPGAVSIPGCEHADDPGVFYNLYEGSHNGYITPGPKPYVEGNIGKGPVEDRKERGDWKCLVQNANWCGKKIPGFRNAGECWDASANCFQQVNDCYNTAPATGNNGCTEWEQKCTSCQEQCKDCEAGGSCNGYIS